MNACIGEWNENMCMFKGGSVVRNKRQTCECLCSSKQVVIIINNTVVIPLLLSPLSVRCILLIFGYEWKKSSGLHWGQDIAVYLAAISIFSYMYMEWIFLPFITILLFVQHGFSSSQVFTRWTRLVLPIRFGYTGFFHRT